MMLQDLFCAAVSSFIWCCSYLLYTHLQRVGLYTTGFSVSLYLTMWTLILGQIHRLPSCRCLSCSMTRSVCVSVCRCLQSHVVQTERLLSERPTADTHMNTHTNTGSDFGEVVVVCRLPALKKQTAMTGNDVSSRLFLSASSSRP